MVRNACECVLVVRCVVMRMKERFDESGVFCVLGRVR